MHKMVAKDVDATRWPIDLFGMTGKLTSFVVPIDISDGSTVQITQDILDFRNKLRSCCICTQFVYGLTVDHHGDKFFDGLSVTSDFLTCLTDVFSTIFFSHRADPSEAMSFLLNVYKQTRNNL